MTSFKEGNYLLCTEDESNKSLLFVKLTDSALHSIEMYLKSEGDPLFKPTIHFQDNSGIISIPVSGEKCNYEFSVSTIEPDGLQSKLQCLEYPGKRSLKALGLMLKKLQIHANEDSYEKTKFKMAAIEKEQKSLCTKEIKTNGRCLQRKVKRKYLGMTISPPLASSISESSNVNTRNQFSKTHSILKQSLRKRLIHILAIKPYRKPELLLRLTKEGISDEDKKNLDYILSFVGSLKGNVYHLASNLWNEIDEDWEFCSKEELQLMQRRKQQSLKTNSEINIPDTKKSNNCFSIQNDDICTPINKKQKKFKSNPKSQDLAVKDTSSQLSNCNNFKLPEEKLYLQPKVSGNCNGITEINKYFVPENGGKISEHKNGSNIAEVSSQNHIPLQSHDISSRNLSDCTIKDQLKLKNSMDGQGEVYTYNKYNNLELKGNPHHYSSTMKTSFCKPLSPVNEFKEYVSSTIGSVSSKINNSNMVEFRTHPSNNLLSFCKTYCDDIVDSDLDADPSEEEYEMQCEQLQMYTVIESDQQRAKYAQDFETEYREYVKLHGILENVKQKYKYLDHAIAESVYGSSQFEKLVNEYIQEGSRLTYDEEYIFSYRKYKFLMAKLSLIKELIKEYDDCQMDFVDSPLSR